jgi:4-hydroxy-3-polyprenylbenzoate decarboxylase
MAYKDLREWIDYLESEGELRRVKTQVDWNLEIGGIVREVSKRKGPAIVFENIKGYRKSRGRRLFVGGLGAQRRVAMMLGLSKDAHPRELILHVREKLRHPIKPVIVETGPLKQNIVKGKDINLLDFPVPKWHHLDGGRYIDTFCGVVTKDPATGMANLGCYRGMVVDRNKIAKLLVAVQHWGLHFSEYSEKMEPMPVAVVYGWDDAMVFAAGIPVPHPRGASEWELIGGLRGEPVELVRCSTIDLEVPALAEVVVEGTVSPDPKTFVEEGPFGEFTGYYGGTASPKPVLKVSCITYRNDPILRGSLEGVFPGIYSESCELTHIGLSAIAWNLLEDAGVPGVLDVCCSKVTLGTNTYVRIKKLYRGQAKQVASALWGSQAAQWYLKNIMVVDEDVDIFDYEALDWAFAYRVNAGEDDIVVMPGSFGSLLDPSTRIEDRDVMRFGSGKWNRVLIDATKNWNYTPVERWGGDVYPPLNTIDADTQAKVHKKWSRYGLD